jgi:hypothetical protein
LGSVSKAPCRSTLSLAKQWEEQWKKLFADKWKVLNLRVIEGTVSCTASHKDLADGDDMLSAKSPEIKLMFYALKFRLLRST